MVTEATQATAATKKVERANYYAFVQWKAEDGLNHSKQVDLGKYKDKATEEINNLIKNNYQVVSVVKGKQLPFNTVTRVQI